MMQLEAVGVTGDLAVEAVFTAKDPPGICQSPDAGPPDDASTKATATIANDIQSARRLLLATKPTKSFSGTTINVSQSRPAPVICVTAET